MILLHKKNIKKIQAAKIQKIIFHRSYHDGKLAEVISRMTLLDVMGHFKEPIEVHLVPNVENDEVLLDSFSRGSSE